MLKLYSMSAKAWMNACLPSQVVRPSFFTSPIFPFIALASLTLGAISAYRIYYLPVMKNMLIWTSGAIAVYW